MCINECYINMTKALCGCACVYMLRMHLCVRGAFLRFLACVRAITPYLTILTLERMCEMNRIKNNISNDNVATDNCNNNNNITRNNHNHNSTNNIYYNNDILTPNSSEIIMF